MDERAGIVVREKAQGVFVNVHKHLIREEERQARLFSVLPTERVSGNETEDI